MMIFVEVKGTLGPEAGSDTRRRRREDSQPNGLFPIKTTFLPKCIDIIFSNIIL